MKTGKQILLIVAIGVVMLFAVGQQKAEAGTVYATVPNPISMGLTFVFGDPPRPHMVPHMVPVHPVHPPPVHRPIKHFHKKCKPPHHPSHSRAFERGHQGRQFAHHGPPRRPGYHPNYWHHR